jgi:hypothetical protein
MVPHSSVDSTNVFEEPAAATSGSEDWGSRFLQKISTHLKNYIPDDQYYLNLYSTRYKFFS